MQSPHKHVFNSIIINILYVVVSAYTFMEGNNIELKKGIYQLSYDILWITKGTGCGFPCLSPHSISETAVMKDIYGVVTSI